MDHRVKILVGNLHSFNVILNSVFAFISPFIFIKDIDVNFVISEQPRIFKPQTNTHKSNKAKY